MSTTFSSSPIVALVPHSSIASYALCELLHVSYRIPTLTAMLQGRIVLPNIPPLSPLYSAHSCPFFRPVPYLLPFEHSSQNAAEIWSNLDLSCPSWALSPVRDMAYPKVLSSLILHSVSFLPHWPSTLPLPCLQDIC